MKEGIYGTSIAEKTSHDHSGPLLKVENLRVDFRSRGGETNVLRGVDFHVDAGETVAIVGESGCGKSMTARSILGIVPSPGYVSAGRIIYNSPNRNGPVELCGLPVDGPDIRAIRGKEIAMIFQEPMASLSPVHTIGNQIMEAVLLHVTPDRSIAQKKAIDALSMVGIPNPKSRMHDYPFQLSGGMRQRVMLAMAISCEPRLLLADEPTTALDVTIQAQMIALLKKLQKDLNLSIILITHDLGVVAAMAERIAVMYLGRIIEEASSHSIFSDPKHPYTLGLLKSIPIVGQGKAGRLMSIPGVVPDMREEIGGCPFHPRCSEFMSGKCDTLEPETTKIGAQHSVRCLLYGPSNTDRPHAPNSAEGNPK